MTNMERWQPVVGYEGVYEVSNLGRVRSLDRTVRRGAATYFRAGVLLTPKRQTTGHLWVGLCSRGRKTAHRIHALVLAAFTGPRPKGMEIRHLDGDAKNNALTNLVYGTSSENKHDAYAHGALKSGEASHFARLSNAEVQSLRSLRGSLSSRAAAERFGLNAGYVRAIWRGDARRYA